MIIEDLKNDIQNALKSYIEQFSDFSHLSKHRQKDVKNITVIMQGTDPILVFDRLHNYLETLELPLINWLKFIDINNFYWTIKNILLKEKYQEINFMRMVIIEKEHRLTAYKNKISSKPCASESSVEEKLKEIMVDVKLLRSENNFLYTTLIDLNKKVIHLESVAQNNFQRAQHAEEALLKLEREQLDLVHCQSIANSSSQPNTVPSL
jgi:hypothetical protein